MWTSSIRELALAPVLMASAVGLTACSSDSSPEPLCEDKLCSSVVADARVKNGLDLLFVIDNSGSMAEEQESLAANIDMLIAELAHSGGVLPNLHIGVVSADMGVGPYSLPGCTAAGDDGVLQSAPQGACQAPEGSYIEDYLAADAEPGDRDRNYPGSLTEAFSCIAQLGIDGCGYEQPLEAMYRALDGSNPTNDGFLRPNAYLGVVIVTDEDDCSVHDTAMFDPSQDSIDSALGPVSSFRCFEFGVACDGDNPREPGERQSCQPRIDSLYMQSVDRYVEFLKGLKEDPADIMVAGIYGDPSPVTVGLSDQGTPELEPSCSTAAGNASPAVRLQYFLDQFPGRNLFHSICNDSFATPLKDIGSSFQPWMQGVCLDGAIADADAAAPGIQAECTVIEVAPGGAETELPACDAQDPASATNLPCYVIRADEQACSATPTHLVLEALRGAEQADDGTRVQATCMVEGNTAL